MGYLRLGWVGCRSIYSRDDSPFAYIFSGAVNFFAWGRSLTRVFRTCVRSWSGKRTHGGFLGTKHLKLDYMVHIHTQRDDDHIWRLP